MRTIAIVGGTGPLGSGLAKRLAKAGEKIIIGSRDAKRAQEAAAKLNGKGTVEGADNAAAVRGAQVVIVAVPFEAQAETLKQLKGAFQPGQIVIDCTVPLAASVGGRPSRVIGVWQGSAAQQAAELVPKDVAVAAAFHNVSAEVLGGDDEKIDCDVIVCSDDANAGKTARELAEKIPGVRAIDGGKLENARIVEQITALLIGINVRYKAGHCGLRITGLPNKK